MITALDAIEDPDEDSQADDDPIDDDELEGPEHPDDEPSLGATEAINQEAAWRVTTAQSWVPDGEPSLGSLECVDQTRWASGRNDEREEEHNGCEPDVDDEPSLGSIDSRMDQTMWFSNASADLEHDDAEHEGAVDDGPCDTDELEACDAHDDELPRKTVAASIDDQAATTAALKALGSLKRRRRVPGGTS
jgi:hypothetical protein